MAQFSDTTEKDGIIQKIEFITGLGDASISGNSVLLKQITGFVNDWLGVLVGDVLQVDGRFQWDDTNYTDQPIATFNLVSAQRSYSFTQDEDLHQILDITRVEVLDDSGLWHLLKPLDQNQISQGYNEFLKGDGIPQWYDWNGTVLNIFPATNYASTNGCKVWFKREGSFFASTDTTKEPGFVSPFQKVLWLGPAYDYGLSQGKENTNALRQEIELERERLREFYSRRGKYEQPRITGRVRSAR